MAASDRRVNDGGVSEPGDADGDRRRGYGGDPGPAPSWPPPDHAGNSAGRATRWWPLLLIGLIAVVVVAVVLHPRAPLATPTPVPPPTASTRSVVSRTTPTTPSPRTSMPPLLADPAQVSPRTTDLGRPILGITGGWELFGRGPDGVVRIELAKGRLTSTAVPGLGSSGPVSFLVGPDRAVIRPLDFVPGFAVDDGRNATVLTGALSHGGPLIPGPDAGHVWADTAADGSPDVMTLVDWQGRSTATHFGVPAGWSAVGATSDGAGNVLLTAPNGGTYQVRPDGRRLVTAGTLLASGPTGYLVSECDAAGTCRTSVLDRNTGTRKVLAASITGGLGGAGVISPDGKTAAVIDVAHVGSSALRLSLVDLSSGVEHPLSADIGTPIRQSSMVWAPDSRRLFVATDAGKLAVVDRTTGPAGDLGLSLPFIQQLAIRPTPTTEATTTRTTSATGGANAPSCSRPDGIGSTNRPVQVGKPGAPTIGPLSFHPYPYAPGFPTKMIVYAEHDLAQPVVTRGYRCSDGKPLRFQFTYGGDTLPTPPYTDHQMQQVLGHTDAALHPMTAGGDMGGYALFSSAGQWAITLEQGKTVLGLVRIDVTTAATR